MTRCGFVHRISVVECWLTTALAAVHADLVEIENDIAQAKAAHNAFLVELGLKPLP